MQPVILLTTSDSKQSYADWCLQTKLDGKTHRTVTTLFFHFVPVYRPVHHRLQSAILGVLEFNTLLHPVGGGACYCLAMVTVTVWLNHNLASSI